MVVKKMHREMIYYDDGTAVYVARLHGEIEGVPVYRKQRVKP
jgi:hypothetical protein